MKLIVFTPASKASAIGRMAALVTRKLVAQGHEVVVARTETETLLSTDTHDFGTPVLAWNQPVKLARAMRDAEAAIYHIGDNFELHKGCLHWLPRLPGLVCLHDFYLGHLFSGWAHARRPEARAILKAWYGEAVADRFFRFSNSQAFIEGTRNSAPMTEWVCAMAEGVVTHSGWGCARVLDSCPGPVRVVPLAYDAPGAVNAERPGPAAERQAFQVLTIGHVNPNKRVESVIRAIGNSAVLKQRLTYRLVGHVLPEAALVLAALAKDLGVRLVISGEADDAGLSLAIAESDAISCLRWPSLEAASASAIEAMLYGKPVIVTDTGFYSEIPSHCVLKISPERESADLQSALEHLAADANLGRAIGAQAQQWALATFSADRYASAIIETVQDMMKTRPVLSAVGYMHGLLSRWTQGGTLRHQEQFISELAGPLNLFGSRRS
jgi:glycosyltransferase involved in cell wall biosynthesis